MLKDNDQCTLNPSNTPFREFSVEERKEKFDALVGQSQDKVPIVFFPHPKSKLMPKGEFWILCSRKFQVAICCRRLREHLGLEMESTLTYTCNKNRLILQSEIINDLYQKFKDPKDGFLYIQYSEIQAMGNH